MLRFGTIKLNSDFDLRDSRKVINPDENLSVFVGNQFCSFDSRNIPLSEDIIDVRISQMRHNNYTIMAKFFSDLGVPCFLFDRHTQEYHAINSEGITRIDFENDGSESATANQRFALVFEKTNQSTKIAKSHISIFPNPLTSGRTLNVSQKIQFWELFDLSGKRLAQGQGNNYNQIELPGSLNSGLYTIKVTGLDQSNASELILID